MLRTCVHRLHKVPLSRSIVNSFAVTRGFCDKIDKSEEEAIKLSGFAKAFEKHSMPQEVKQEEELPDLPFATLLKNSKLIDVS